MILASIIASISISTITGIGAPAPEAKAPAAEPVLVAAATDSPPAPPPEVKVVVQKGDSLSKIAASHQLSWQRLYDANPHVGHPDIINPGQEIRIPKPEEQLASRPLPAPAAAIAPPSIQRSKPTASAAFTPVTDGSVWDRLAACESGGRWNINTGNGYYGGLQFSLPTWRSVGGSGLPSEASREEQIARASALQARSGWGQWPACSAKLGLR